VERKRREDPIIDIRKVENNAIDYLLPIDSSNPEQQSGCCAIQSLLMLIKASFIVVRYKVKAFYQSKSFVKKKFILLKNL